MAGVTWVNNDGLEIRYGPSQGQRGPRAGVTMGAGKRRELVLTVDLAGAARTIYPADRNGDGVNDGFSGLDTVLPSGATIISQHMRTLVTPAGGTNFTVGTFLIDGTVDNNSGLMTSAGANGALVGTQLPADRYVAVTTTGTYTAGRVQVVINYLY